MARPAIYDADSMKNNGWTIKGIATDARAAATRECGRKDNEMSIGEWMTRAIREKIQADKNGGRGEVSTPKGTRSVDMIEMAALMAAAKDSVAMGIPLSDKAQKNIQAAIEKASVAVKRGRIEAPKMLAHERTISVPSNHTTGSGQDI